ncbi:MAG TPA: hypothetical protein GX711_07560 [Clostridia bacterium]|nr:hypothetical protein [Clostridia bacterium]
MGNAHGRVGPALKITTGQVRGSARKTAFFVLFFSFFLSILAINASWGNDPAEAREQVPYYREIYGSVWPEHYSADVVVNLTGILVNDTGEAFDGEIVFEMPLEARPITLAEIQNGIIPQYYELVEEKDRQLIIYQRENPLEPGEELSLLLEYRYLQFREGGARNFPVNFNVRFPVKKLNLEIRQPLNSTDFSLQPEEGGKYTDGEGFNVYTYEYLDLPENREMSFQVSYGKSDSEPSLKPEVVEETPAGEKEGMKTGTIALLLGVFLVVLAITLFLALRSGPKGKFPTKDKGVGSTKKAGTRGKSPRKGAR